jgi:hypothetical protein
MKILARVLTASIIAAAGFLVVAPSAQASVNPAVIGFQNPACTPSTTSIVGNPGSTFKIVSVDCGTLAVTLQGAHVTGPASVFNQSAGTYTLGAVGSGGISVFVVPPGGVGMFVSISVTITNDFVPGPILHDDLQQVGVPASGNCDDVDPRVGHYPGAPFGGWSKSWAMWINEGKGGPVCTRELEELGTGEIILIG